MSFRIKSQPNALINNLKYYFEFYNTKAAAYPCNNMCELIEYIEVKNKNKSVEKITKQALYLYNYLQMK